MKPLLLVLLFSILSVFNPKIARAQGGMVGGGGGSGVLIDSKLVLLDFLEFDPAFRDNESFRDLKSLKLSEKLPVLTVVSTTPVFNQEGVIGAEKIELDRYRCHPEDPFNISFKTSRVMNYAKLQLSRYKQTLSKASLSLNDLDWFYTWNKPGPQFRYHSSVPNRKNIYTIAYYWTTEDGRARNYAAILSVPRWNRMGPLSQVGLIIHEALRHFQIHILHSEKKNFTDKNLQSLTSVISLCKYDPRIETLIRKFMDSKNQDFDLVAAKKVCTLY